MSVIDPRAANCRAFHMSAAGKVDGIELVVDVRLLARFKLVRVELIDEVAAQNQIVATCRVLDAGGLLIGDPVWLAWPWPNLTEFALPGNMNGQHPITNAFTPPNVGPLALLLRSADGQIVSDGVGGLGLPHGHHVSFLATWQERAAVVEPAPEPEPGGDGDLVSGVLRIAAAMERLVGHLGA